MRRMMIIASLGLVASLAGSCGRERAPGGMEPRTETGRGKVSGAKDAPAPASKPPRVRIQTTRGDIVHELDAQRAPRSVANFLAYVRAGHYDGTVFHRVVPGFVIQGGGFTAEGERRPTRPPIRNEADNGLRNLRGTLAMARTNALHSATDQFYINLEDNVKLDHRGPDPRRFGYAVFGRVVEGMDVVDAIGRLRTRRRPMPTPAGPVMMPDWPVEDVAILSATVEP